MHLHYPILPQGENPTPEELLKANEVYYGHCNYAGFWLLTTSNGFHGGIHIEEVNKPVHCMADGRIIAYRIGNENIKQKGNEALSFSNAFVLVQHNFTTNKGVSLRFYSLYMHLLPKAELEKDKGKNIPDWCVEHYTSIATNQKELGLRFRLYDEICLHKNNETVFLPKGAILDKADHVSIPDKHWAKNTNYVLCCYKDKTYVVYKNYLDTYDTYYQISFKKAKDENTIDANVPKGAMLFDGIKGTYIGMECIGSDIEIEHTKTKDWYKIKAENKYILAVDCTPLKHRINHDVFKFDGNIHNVDIPIKAGAIVGMPSQYETNLSKNYTVVHLEVFTDDKNLETFINNQKDKDKTTYQAEKDQVLKAAAPCNFLKKDEKVKLFKTDGTYAQVGFENIEAVITYDERIAYDTATQSYAIKTFSKVNTEFDNTLPTDATHLYFDAYMKKNEDGSFDKCIKTLEENAIKKAKKEGKSYTKYRRLLFKHPKHAKKYWVNASEVTGEVGHWITLQNAITEYYKDQPNSTTSDELITKPTKVRKITTAKDASGTEWWHVKTKAEKGWIKKESLTVKNPYMWKDFGWELIPDAGDQYFYMFGKYTDQKEPHPFAKRIIEMVDTNGDGEVSNYELQQAVRAKEKLEITSKLIAKHSSEWGMGDASAAFKEELVKVHEKGIRKATDPENKQELIKKRDAKIEQTLFRVQQLNFWSKLTNGDVTTKAQRKAAFFASKGVTPLNGTIPTGSGAADKAKRDQQLTEAFNALEVKRSPRQFPSTSKVWHFHPIAFVEHMKLITDSGCYCDRDLTVEEVKKLINKNSLFSHDKCPLPDDVKTYQEVTKQLNKALNKYNINTCLKKAHFIAQIEAESDHFKTTVEYADGSAYEGRVDLGNTNTGDGKLFKGRGLIQLTGRTNYTKYFKYINKTSLISTPKIIGENIEYTFDSAGWYWVNGSAWGDMNPKADNDDLISVSIGVNGGLNGYEHRKKNLKSILKTMNIKENCSNLKNNNIGIYKYETSKIRNSKYGKKAKNKLNIKKFDD